MQFYDATGSLTFIACTGLSLYYPFLRRGGPLPSLLSFHPRQLLATAGVSLWAARLGSFLYQRIKKSGSDSRFDEIKKSPTKFAGAWFAQGIWVSLTALPVFAINAIPAAAHPALGLRDAAAAALWVGAFVGEVVADRQKSAWREAQENKKHDEKFISSGLWAYSRHPNYLGEVGLWTAQFLLAFGVLSRAGVNGVFVPGWLRWAAVASPVCEYLLIRYVSGVPLLEVSCAAPVGLQLPGREADWSGHVRRLRRTRSWATILTGRPTSSQCPG